MSHYNGEYEHTFFIIVESDQHDSVVHFMKYIKNAVAPWFFQIKTLKETKSGRSGTILKRTLYIKHQAYSQDIIIFNEMLRTLIWHYNLLYNVTITLDERGTIPKDSRTNLLS